MPFKGIEITVAMKQGVSARKTKRSDQAINGLANGVAVCPEKAMVGRVAQPTALPDSGVPRPSFAWAGMFATLLSSLVKAPVFHRRKLCTRSYFSLDLTLTLRHIRAIDHQYGVSYKYKSFVSKILPLSPSFAKIKPEIPLYPIDSKRPGGRGGGVFENRTQRTNHKS